MNTTITHIAAAAAFAVALAGPAGAGAPQPEQRQGDYVHVCAGGANKDQLCTVPSQDVDCPKSACVVQAVSKTIKGVLTLIAHDSVTDWSNGAATRDRTRSGILGLSNDHQKVCHVQLSISRPETCMHTRIA